MNKFTGILSGWDNILPDELDKTKHRGMITVPELIDKLNSYKQTIEIIEQVKQELEEHIHDPNNPHKVTFDPCKFNITYLLFKEYQDTYNYTKTFDEFVKELYDQYQISSPSDLNDPISNKNKLVNVETLESAISSHNSDSNAHPEIIKSLHNGEPFDIYPRYIFNTKQQTLLSTPYKVTSSSTWNVIGENGLFISYIPNEAIVHYFDNKPVFPLFKSYTNYVPNSETFNNASLSGLIKYTNNDKIPNLRNNYNYIPVIESGNNEHKVTSSFNTVSDNKWVSVNFFYYPILRDILEVTITNNIKFRIQVTNGTVVVKSNTTGKQIFISCDKLSNGYYNIKCSFYSNTFNSIKVNFLKYIDGELSYIADDSMLAGILYNLNVTDTCTVPPPMVTGNGIGTNNSTSCIITLEKLRNIEQGTISITVESVNPTNELQYIYDTIIGNKRISAYIQNYNLILRTSIGSNVYASTITNVNYNEPFKIIVSYGNVGVIYGVTGKELIPKGNIESMTTIEELDAITSNVQDITNVETMKLSEYPYITVKTLNKLTDTMDNIINYLIPHLTAERNANQELITIDTSLARTENTILGVDRFPSTSDKIYLGCRSDNSYHLNGYVSELLIYDIAANQEQIKFLLNKHYEPYSNY